MKKISNLFKIFIFIFFVVPIYAFVGVDIKSGYISNISGFRDDTGSAYLSPYLYVIQPFDVSDKFTFIVDGNVLFNKYFSDSSSDFIEWNLLLRLKQGGLSGFIFDIGSKGKLNNKEKQVYDNYSFYFTPQYFFELDNFGIYFYPSVGIAKYPNDIYDNYYFSLGFKVLYNLSWVCTLFSSVFYTKEYYNEYYLPITPTLYSSDKMESSIGRIKIGIEYLLLTYLNILGTFEIEKNSSNGNYLYYGPYETYLILDGDEAVVKDYFSSTNYNLTLQVEYDFSSGRITPSLNYKYEKYSNRYPLNELDLLNTKEKLFIKSLNFSINSQFFIGESTNLNINFSYTSKTSNEYWEDLSFYDVNISLNLIF